MVSAMKANIFKLPLKYFYETILVVLAYCS